MAHDDPMAELTVTALRVVQAVVATGSFTAAADLLGYTQSGVSRQVTSAPGSRCERSCTLTVADPLSRVLAAAITCGVER